MRLSGYSGQGLTACPKNQLDLQSCWPQSTQGNGEAGCAGLQPTSRENRGLNQRKLTVSPDALYV